MSTQSHMDKVNLTPNLMEYPHHVGAPKIVPTDLSPFKQNGTDKANKIFNRRYEELIKEIKTLQSSRRARGPKRTYTGPTLPPRSCSGIPGPQTT